MTDFIGPFVGPYRFLSNFYPAYVTYEGRQYRTTEHAYQAAKTTVFEERTHIRRLSTPGAAKRAGRGVTMRPDWDAVKLKVMLDLTNQKFTTHDSLAQMLLATGDTPIIELNTWGDLFWGQIQQRDGELVGENNLGRILMAVRDDLKGAGL